MKLYKYGTGYICEFHDQVTFGLSKKSARRAMYRKLFKNYSNLRIMQLPTP